MMKKWPLRIALGVVIIIIAVPITALVYIDRIAKSAVEHGGTYALGVNTSLDGMDVGVLAGCVEMDRLNVNNPQGFDTPHFLRLNNGRFAVSLGSLMEDKVVAPELTLSGLSMNLERKHGKSNYAVIIDNLKRFESDQKQPGEEPRKEGKRFVIEKVVIDDVQVQVDLLPVGGQLTRVPLRIERLELENVGSDSDQGVLLAELTAILTEAILTAVVQKGGDLIPADIAGELSKGLQGLDSLRGTAMQVVGDVSAEVAKQVDEVGKEVGKAVDEGGKAVEKGLDDAGKQLEEGVGRLLGGGKKKEDKQSEEGEGD